MAQRKLEQMDKLRSALGMKADTNEGDAFNRDLQVGGRAAAHPPPGRGQGETARAVPGVAHTACTGCQGALLRLLCILPPWLLLLQTSTSPSSLARCLCVSPSATSLACHVLVHAGATQAAACCRARGGPEGQGEGGQAAGKGPGGAGEGAQKGGKEAREGARGRMHVLERFTRMHVHGGRGGCVGCRRMAFSGQAQLIACACKRPWPCMKGVNLWCGWHAFDVMHDLHGLKCQHSTPMLAPTR